MVGDIIDFWRARQLVLAGGAKRVLQKFIELRPRRGCDFRAWNHDELLRD